MQIDSAKSFLVPLGKHQNRLLVRLETDSGVAGWGEAATHADRETVVQQYVEQLGRYLIGRSPFAIKQTVQAATDDFAQRIGSYEHACAVSGVEQAMWDIVGKAAGQPLYRLLGGACRPRVRVVDSGWFGGAQSPQEIAGAAEAAVREGFSALKLAPFDGPLRSFAGTEVVRQAASHVRAVREAVGPDVDLMVDLQRRLAPMRAVEFAQEIEEAHPFWLEEPCSGENLDVLLDIRKATRIPIVVGKALFTKERFQEALEKGVADILSLDVGSVGGILQMREIAAMAEPYSVAITARHAGSNLVGLAATLHAVAGMPNFMTAEVSVDPAGGNHSLGAAIRPTNGYLPLPDGPGLGIAVEEEVVAALHTRRYAGRVVLRHDEEGP